MKTALLPSLILLLVSLSYSQENINIIPNYSFEDGYNDYEPECNYTNCWNPGSSVLPIDKHIKYWNVACKNIGFLTNDCKNKLNTPDWFHTECDNYTYNGFLSDEFNQSTCEVNLDNTAPSNRFIFLYAGYNKITNCKGKEKYNEGVRVGLKQKLTENKTYLLKLKIKPIQKRYYCDNIADDDHLIYTGKNNLKVHFTKWGLHWNSTSSNNQKWEDAAIIWKDFNNDNTQCEWEQVYYEITVPSGKTDLKNMILYCSEGGFFIDDVELYEKCPTTIYFQNRGFNIPNHPYAYFADDKIVAGKNVTTAIENGDVIVNQHGNVNFIAANEVRLKHGFRTNGGEFHAFNQTCLSSKSKSGGRNDLYNKTNLNYDSKILFIYPNPFQNSFTLEISPDFGKDIQLHIVDMQGNVLKSDKINLPDDVSEFTTKISAQNLKPGMYILQLIGESKIETIRIIKQ
ncbi:MAG: T9SS type A sorting domain-containing protein [Bacteroidales bacterium]